MAKKKFKYKVATNVMKGYDPDWNYYRTFKEAKKAVKDDPQYPMVVKYIYKNED